MNVEAESYDLDGVVFKRQIPLQFNALKKLLLNGNSIYNPPELPEIFRDVRISDELSVQESLSLYFHSKRPLKSGIVEYMAHRSTVKFGNTGRLNKLAWKEMTLASLQRQGVSQLFEDVFFRYEGIKTIQSKGAVLRMLSEEYPRLTHYDDNPADVLGLAKLLPEVQFVIVQDLSTGMLLSRAEMTEYPNVRRVASL